MNTRMLSRARALFSSDFVPESVNRANRLKWCRSIRRLGPAWVYAEHQKPTHVFSLRTTTNHKGSK